MYPSVDQEYKDIVDSGYAAARLWNGYKFHKVGFRQPNYPALLFLWAFMYVEYVLFSTIDMLYIIISFTLALWEKLRRYISMTL